MSCIFQQSGSQTLPSALTTCRVPSSPPTRCHAPADGRARCHRTLRVQGGGPPGPASDPTLVPVAEGGALQGHFSPLLLCSGHPFSLEWCPDEGFPRGQGGDTADVRLQPRPTRHRLPGPQRWARHVQKRVRLIATCRMWGTS